MGVTSAGLPCLHCVLLPRARAGALGDGAEPVSMGFALAHVAQRNFSVDGRSATGGFKHCTINDVPVGGGDRRILVRDEQAVSAS